MPAVLIQTKGSGSRKPCFDNFRANMEASRMLSAALSNLNFIFKGQDHGGGSDESSTSFLCSQLPPSIFSQCIVSLIPPLPGPPPLLHRFLYFSLSLSYFSVVFSGHLMECMAFPPFLSSPQLFFSPSLFPSFLQPLPSVMKCKL